MNRTRRSQGGAALLTALVFLIIITMLALSAMRSSTLELKMSSNEESKVTSFQRAQAIIDATIHNPDNTQVFGEVGRRVCIGSDASDTPDDLDCDAFEVSMSDDLYADDVDAGRVKIAVTRLSPLESPAPRALGTSASAYAVAKFKVDALYDGAADGLGKSRIAEGVMVLVSKG